MFCRVCGAQVTAQQTACPHCGAFLGTSQPGVIPDPPKTFRVLLAGSLAILVALGFAGYHLFDNSKFQELIQQIRDANTAITPTPRERAVEHGGIANPDELEAHGKLYFIPMGRQAIPIDSLVAYYHDKFKIDITTLPEVTIGPSSYDRSRGQYIAEEMILDMKRAYPKIARSADSVMIILTDEDIYPRSLHWKFTYSFHNAYKFAVVSSHRDDPAFWDSAKPHDPAVQLASLKQMLTKYIAMLYFHVPHSFDPTSIMYQPLTPNGGPDDLYESDLHSEESVNGFRGQGWPCLIYSYSYKTGVMRHLAPAIEECAHIPAPASPDEEVFETQLSTGEFFQYAIDFQLDSVPPIEFRRSYRSQYVPSMALGRGANDNYNTWLTSDGPAKLSYIDIISEDGGRNHLVRKTAGTGFSPSAVFENRDSSDELYGARFAWDTDHFKLQYRDSSWSTFLPDGYCYWSGYQDFSGHVLRFERDAALNLTRLTASDQQGIEFQSDPQHRLSEGKDTSGNQVTYEYDPPGRLVRVSRSNGRVTLYTYDDAHRMTSMAVIGEAGGSPVPVFTNEYDSSGRVIRQTLGDGSVYTEEYTKAPRSDRNNVKITEPSGRVLEITRPSDYDYIVHTTPVRFPAVL
jgi:YD repeat-containing protein